MLDGEGIVARANNADGIAEWERQVREVVRADAFERIAASRLLDQPDEDAVILLRREITNAHLAGKPLLLCAQCGHSVFVSANRFRRGFHFKHHQGAPLTCEWYTGETKSPRDVGAEIHQGVQEGPLHRALKERIAAILEKDPAVSSVDVQSYVPGEDARGRFPDVRAVRNGRSVVFEIQLATIQVPTLSARTTFYRQQGMHLIWVLWSFDPHHIRRISIRDTYVPNRRNAFLVDHESLEESERRRTLLLRVFWPQPRLERGAVIQEWMSKLVTLDELQYPDDFSPFYLDPAALKEALFVLQPDVRDAFKKCWINDIDRHGEKDWRFRVYKRISDRAHLGIPEGLLKWMAGASDLRHVLNFLFSLEEDRVVGSSGHPRIVSILNDLLEPTQGCWLWPIIDAAIKLYSGQEKLNRDWVQERLSFSRGQFNVPSEEMDAAFMLISAIFPDLDLGFRERALALEKADREGIF